MNDLEKWKTRKLISVAWHSRDEAQSLLAFQVLLNRFKEMQSDVSVNAQAKASILKDFLKVFRDDINRNDHALNLLEALYREKLLSIKDCSYVAIYARSAKVAKRALEMFVSFPRLTIDEVRFTCKEIPLERRGLKLSIQNFLITRKDVAVDDLRYVAEFGVTSGIATKSAVLLINHPDRDPTSLGRVYRASDHRKVRRLVRHLVK